MTRTASTGMLLAAALTLTGCGGGTEAAAPPSRIPASTGSLDFDAYAVGSEQGQENSADLYGLRFNPLRVFRITTDKRVSTMAASTEQVVVAAADEQIDRLGVVAPDGSIGPVPGLGRPHAFSPEVLPNEVIRFEDSEGTGTNEARYLEWNPAASKQSVVRTAPAGSYGGFGSGLEGTIYRAFDDSTGQRKVTLLGGERERTFALPPLAGAVRWGKTFLAVTVREPNSAGPPALVGFLLLDPKSGKRITVDGWSPVSWSPEGTALWVVRTGGAAEQPTELGVLEESNPTAVRSIGTIPYLGIYGGSWVKGTPAS
ncbi:MAG: hypothetical protein ACT4QG_03240 [Sporichthyaceae bacterium]